jgi:hypothetical protein
MRGSYDYLHNTRENQMPGPTWTYSQGFFTGWNSFYAVRQPSPEEAAVQVMSVVASGAKGFMMFESAMVYVNATAPPDVAASWATVGALLRAMGAMRELYRVGDITGMATALSANGSADASVIVELVRGPRALVLLLINIANDGGYSDLGCAVGLPLHWNMTAHTVAAVTVAVPLDFGAIVDSFEVSNATVLPGGVVPVRELTGWISFVRVTLCSPRAAQPGPVRRKRGTCDSRPANLAR